MGLDAFYLQLGKPGLYHIIVYLLLFTNWIPVCNNTLVMTFFAVEPPHRCKVPSGVSPNVSLPRDGDGAFSKCYAYEGFNSSTNITVRCPLGWEYDEDAKTITTEWDLVCDRTYLKNIATAVFFIGTMIGGLILGPLSDKFGRRPVLLCCLYLPIPMAVALVFVRNFILFVVLRFLLGFCMLGLEMTSMVIISELYPTTLRTVPGSLINLSYAVGNMYIALVSYLLKDWHYIQLIIHLPSVFMICQVWLVPESPRWLLAKGHYKEVRKFFHKAAKFNKVQFSDKLFDEHISLLKQHKEEEERNDKHHLKEGTFSLIDLFKTAKLRRWSLILFFQWFVMIGGYISLSMNISSFDGSIYLNYFIGALLEIPAYLLAAYLLIRLGRTRPMACYYAIGGVACILAGCLPKETVDGTDINLLTTAFALVGRMCISAVFSVQCLLTSEVFPTVVRNIGLGACATIAKLGGTILPQILYLGTLTFREMPMIIIGTLSLGAGASALLLPETRGRPLSDTIEEAESLSRHNNKNKTREKMFEDVVIE